MIINFIKSPSCQKLGLFLNDKKARK
ncbi:hypothetical protein LBKG_00579 [Lactobacillus crispatus CTV-05]|nr:hypothetical protein LBKG_00579 [Lactobacillus crispatus CTV-05]